MSAEINGRVVNGAITVPNKAIYQGSYVYIVKDGKLLRKEIDIAWQNANFAILAQGVNAGEKLVITPLGQVNSGTPVAITKLDDVEVKAEVAAKRKALRRQLQAKEKLNDRLVCAQSCSR